MYVLKTKEFSSPIFDDMIAKRYDGSKIIFSLTAVDKKDRFLDENKQYDFTIDTDLGIVYSNTQILTEIGIKNDNSTHSKIEPIISVSYIYVTYEKSCDGVGEQNHTWAERNDCSWYGTNQGPQRWTQVFIVSGAGVNTQGYNYNHYNNDDGAGGSSFVPYGGTPKTFIRNISKSGETILVAHVLDHNQAITDFVNEDPVFVSFLFKYLNYNGFTNDGIQVAHHWVQKYYETQDMVYFEKIVELAREAAADVHSLITFLELDDEQTFWIMDNADVRNQLIDFVKANNTPQAKAFAVEALIALMAGNYIGVNTGSDQTNFDQSFWDNINFPQQNLPNFTDFDNSYPKTDGGLMLPENVFELIGGDVLSLANLHGYTNACAARVSRALNYSGVVIPNIPGKTFKGFDNKYYFLGARKLYEWMKKTFGNPNISLNQSQAKTDGSGFLGLALGKKGLYIMIPNYPSQFGASGHADIFNGSSFNKNGYFGANGGLHSANLWILN